MLDIVWKYRRLREAGKAGASVKTPLRHATATLKTGNSWPSNFRLVQRFKARLVIAAPASVLE